MDLVLPFAVPAFVGAVAVAYLLRRLRRQSSSPIVQTPPRYDQPSTDIINIAHIQVVGVGGLGLVAMCAVVALYIPAVGLSLAAGFGLGTVFAIVLIARGRRSGPIPSSSQRPGASTVLSIDDIEPQAERDSPTSSERPVLAQVIRAGRAAY
jgi:hypothetical protein